MKELNQKTIKQIIFLIAFAILLYTVIQNFAMVLSFLTFSLKIFFPFILGLIIAFVLNVPVSMIENKVENRKNVKRTNPKLLRIFSISISFLLLILLSSFVLLLVIPEIGKTLQVLIDKIPSLINSLKTTLDNLTISYPEINQYIASIQMDATRLQSTIQIWLSVGLTGFLNTSFNVIISFFSGLMNLIMSIIFAIYILSEKEKIGFQVKSVLFAYIREDKVKKILSVAEMTHHTFTKFITGQCMESLILGLLYFIGMVILRFPYALPISVLVAITAMIPIFGAFISAGLGTLLILIINPVQAIWFVIFFVIIQQIEATFIYPKVVGKSVSLPAMWVMLAVMIGGSLFGIAGMLVSVPVSSILYALLKQDTKERLDSKKKRIKI